MREPTQEELEMTISMGFDVEPATAALQMANYNASVAIEILLNGGR